MIKISNHLKNVILSILVCFIFYTLFEAENLLVNAATTIPSTNGTLSDYMLEHPDGLVGIYPEGPVSSEYAFFPQIYPGKSKITYMKRGVKQTNVISSTAAAKGTAYATMATTDIAENTYIYVDFVGYYKGIPISMKITPLQVIGTTTFGLLREKTSEANQYKFLSLTSTSDSTDVPKVKYEFFNAVTDEPQKLSGYFFFDQLINAMFFGFHNDMNMQNVFINTGSTLGYNDNNSEEFIITKGSVAQGFTILFGPTDHMTLSHNTGRRTSNASSSFARAPSTKLTELVIHHPAPVESVSTKDGKTTFKILQTLSSRKATEEKELIIQSPLEADLVATKIRILNVAGIDISPGFNCYVNAENVVICEAKPEWLEVENNFADTIMIEIDTELSKEKNYKLYYDTQIEKIVVPNQSMVTTTTSREQTSNQVEGKFEVLEPRLSVEKKANPTEVTVYDTITYSIRLTNDKEAGTAHTLNMADELPEELTYVPNSTQIIDSLGEIHTLSDEIHWENGALTYTHPLLFGGSSITLTFQANVNKQVDAISNTIYIDGRNMVDERLMEEASVLTPINSRLIKLNLAQIVVNPSKDLVLPNKGFMLIKAKKEKTDTGIVDIHASIHSTIYQLSEQDFTDITIMLNKEERYVYLLPTIPSNYQYVGYQTTKTMQIHDLDNIKKDSSAILNITQQKEYWVTVYITPSNKHARLYHWDYLINE